jgi:hypothetical protein
MIAFVGICCAIVGTVLGAMKASGREHLTVSLLMIGEHLSSVAEPVYFCAAPALACQEFRLRLRPFSPYILEKNIKFSWFKKFCMIFKYINDHQKVTKK